MAAMLNVAAYHFTPLADPGGLAAELRLAATDAALKGTLLVAPEGINLFLAGEDAAVRGLIDGLRAQPGFEGLQAKYSHSARIPFDRLKVKLKDEIISFRHPQATPLAAGEWLATALPDALWQPFERASHAPFLSHESEFTARLGDFLAARL